MNTIELVDVWYHYDKKKPILKGVTACMEAGKVYAVLGSSGCGKTTLLSLIGGLDVPAKGRVLFEGEALSRTGLAAHRRKNVSFVFQNYNLIDYMTPLENVRLASKRPPLPLLQRLGLEMDDMKRGVLKLSGGQQQRVAIARALASEAPIILADEPTGNLDEDTAQAIAAILRQSASEYGKCVVIVTHSAEIAKRADVVFRLKQGKIQLDEWRRA